MRHYSNLLSCLQEVWYNDRYTSGGASMQKTFKTNKNLILYFLKGSKRYFALSVLFAVLSSLFDLINPKIISFTVDYVLTAGQEKLPVYGQLISRLYGGTEDLRGHLYRIALLVILIAVLGAVFRYLFRLFNSMGAEKLVETMRNRLFRHIAHLSYAWYSGNQTGDIIQRCTSDVETVKRFVSEQLTGMFRILVMIVLSLYFMAGIHFRLMLLSACFVPMIFLYSLFFHKKIGKTFLAADEEEGKLSSIAQENLTGVRVVRAFGRENDEKERFEKQNNIYTSAYMKLSVLISVFWSMGDFFSGLQVMAIVVLGVIAVVRGSMSAGDYIAFISYNAMLVWPVRSLGRVISDMSKAGVSVDRIRYIMDSPEEADPADALTPDMHADICFKDVTFRYREDAPLLLDHISFTIPQGAAFGILGSTGSGKSTLMALLLRLYALPEDCGSISVGGTDIRKISAEWLRTNIGMVLQEPFLFSKTLKENISIAADAADDEDIRAAVRIADLEDTVRHFRNGYDTMVGERGVSLSGGQRQRTAIAQMVIRQTPVMIFDDSLSAVDSETDAKIREALAEKARGATVILISHRISTLMEASEILVLHHGRAAELGSHQELYRKNGIYRKICDIQGVSIDGKE